MLCLLLLLLSVFGSSHQQCCFPSQWEGIEAGVMETVQPAAKVPISTKVSGRVEVFFAYYCSVQGNIRPCFLFILFALVVVGRILMSKIVSLKTQLCLGEFKTVQNCK